MKLQSGGKEGNTLFDSVNDKEPRPGHKKKAEEMHPSMVATHSRGERSL